MRHPLIDNAYSVAVCIAWVGTMVCAGAQLAVWLSR